MRGTTLKEQILRKCSGCGVHLQTENVTAPGYIPIKAWERTPVVCQRCFRIIHYNEAMSVTVDQDEFLRMLSNISHQKGLIIHIVDLFDFDGSIISGLQRFVGNNPVLLVVNKIDLLPKGTNWNRITNWIQQRVKEYGIRIVDIALVSAKRNLGFDRLLWQIGKWRQNDDVYVVGATNVGKSMLINRFIRDYSQLQSELTTSRYPGTTLDAIHIPLEDGKHMVDTPGIVYKSRLTELVATEDLAVLLPAKPIRPVGYELNEGQTLFFGAWARFDFVKGKRQSFTCYLSNELPIHRTKLERADELYRQHCGTLLSPPTLINIHKLPSWGRHSFRIKGEKKTDIFIAGLGWISCNGLTDAWVDIHAPKGVKVIIRQAFM